MHFNFSRSFWIAVQVICLLNLKAAFAQHECAFDLLHHHDEAFEAWLSDKIKARRSGINQLRTSGAPDTIPVVFHVVHKGEPYGTGTNLPDKSIHELLESLNRDINKQNPDTVNIPEQFKDKAASLNVHFALAQRTPEDLPTTGIVRTLEVNENWDWIKDSLFVRDHWPPEDYLNIWVGDIVRGYAGWSFFPDYTMPGFEHYRPVKAHMEGIYIDYTVCASRSRILTHEMGHFLGLLHVWGYRRLIDCSNTDYVDDTPTSVRTYLGRCSDTDRWSCDSEDMVENHMYYTRDSCRLMFSKGQVERMRVVLENAPLRASLLRSDKYVPPICNLAITEVPVPDTILCNTKFSSVVTIQNKGNIPVDTMVIHYQVNQGPWLLRPVGGQVLAPGGFVDIGYINDMALHNGSHTISLKVTVPGGVDADTSDNVFRRNFVMNDQRHSTPYIEDFQSENGWVVFAGDSSRKWLISPALDFSGATAASMHFRKTDEYLELRASGNCESTFYDVLRPNERNNVDLNRYAGRGNVRIAFTYRNSMPTDYVEFFHTDVERLVEFHEDYLKMYPNPAYNGKFSISFRFKEEQDVAVEIYNVLGHKLMSRTFSKVLNQTYDLDISDRNSGVYLVSVHGVDFAVLKKLVVSH